ncbi:Uncharacterised protein [Mycoplasmopsis maculosa]|uniref:Uncharacterized protein n=1 Tax=Mycoplasmopsis maculosa TaxID=114885 RepID=A0A449B463_9BACT|nr:hypothetical protein [Mycoplasmopsis maculosa]VEU75391.1 Uncharacterised protein [Mycoplasmopsis maculosa]
MNEVKLRGILTSKSEIKKTSTKNISYLKFSILASGEFFDLLAFEENAEFLDKLDIKTKPNILVIGKIQKRSEKFVIEDKNFSFRYDIIVSTLFLSAPKRQEIKAEINTEENKEKSLNKENNVEIDREQNFELDWNEKDDLSANDLVEKESKFYQIMESFNYDADEIKEAFTNLNIEDDLNTLIDKGVSYIVNNKKVVEPENDISFFNEEI